MAKSKKEEYFETKYYSALAHITGKDHQIEDLREKLGKKDEDLKKLDKAARKLCEMLLRQRAGAGCGEMVESWEKTDIFKLIPKAADCAININDYWRRHMEKALALIKDQEKTRASMQEELKTLEKTYGDLEKKYRSLEEEYTFLEENERPGGKAGLKKTADKPGSARVSESLQDRAGGKDLPQEADREDGEICDYFSGLSPVEMALETRAEYTRQMRKEGGSIHEKSRRQKEKKKAKDSEQEGLVDEISEGLSEAHKGVLIAIGAEGLSKLSQITEKVKETVSLAEITIRRAAADLGGQGILEPMTCSGAPHMKRVRLYRMTELGKLIYEKLYQKKPVESEVEALLREHGSILHGYGIMETALLFENSTYVRKRSGRVTYLNGRKRIPAGEDKNGNGLSFIPDITIHYSNGSVQYIEYETNDTAGESFKRKCMKYSRVTRNLYFVVPSREDLATILKRIDGWLEEAEKSGCFREGISIRAQAFDALEKSLSETDKDGKRKASEPRWVCRRLNSKKGEKHE